MATFSLSVLDLLILTICIITVTVIILGVYFARQKNSGLIAKQSNQKKENKKKILEIFRNKNENNEEQPQKITNNDVEKLLGVSDATATRYLDELEKEGKLKQVGKTGQGVFYILK